MNKKLISFLVAICLVIGLLPAAAIPHAHAEGAALDEAYALKINATEYKLENYDTAVYFKNEVATEYTSKVVAKDASESDWNAKLIWHTKEGVPDAGPTLYLNGFNYDVYNESTGAWGSDRALDMTDADTPLTIVLQGEDSVMDVKYALRTKSDLTIISEGDTKLTANTSHGFIYAYSGANVTVNANIEASVANYYTGSVKWSGGIVVTAADINIIGGNVTLKTKAGNASLSPITVNTSGSVTISGNANVRLEGSNNYGINGAVPTIKDSAKVVISGAKSRAVSKTLVPVVEGGCYTLKQGTLADGSDADVVEAFTVYAADGVTYMKYYAVERNHIPGEAVLDPEENAYISSCTACGAELSRVPVCAHSGGTATCKEQAKCDNCGTAYGELGACVPNADDGDCTTDITCSVCGEVTTAAAAAHTGGTATCNEQAKCDNCGTAYGELAAHTYSDDPNAGCIVCGAVREATTFVAMIGETGYATLSEALAMAEPGQTVTLLSNVATNSIVKIDKAITLDLGAKSITRNDPRDAATTLHITAAATVKNGTVAAADHGIAVYVDAAATLEGVTVKGADVGIYAKTAVTVKNSAISASVVSASESGDGIRAYNGAVVVLSEGTTVVGSSSGSAVEVYAGAAVTVEAGAQIAENNIVYGGTLTVNGSAGTISTSNEMASGITNGYIAAANIIVGEGATVGQITLNTEDATVTGAESLNVITTAGDKAWYTEGKYIVHDHTEEDVPAVEAKCTETGLTAGVKCSVCGDILTAQEIIPAKGHEYTDDSDTSCNVCGAGPTLAESYTLKLKGASYKLTNYDMPIYLKNGTDSATNTTVTAGTESDWNAKLIWHTGDTGPTLYMDGLVINYYDGTTMGKNSVKVIETPTTAPLTIVLQGKDSVLGANYIIWYYNDITIRSEGDTKLTAHATRSFMHSVTSGAGITFDANLDAQVYSRYNATYQGIRVKDADVNIIGGNVSIRTHHGSMYGICISGTGNVYVDNAEVTLRSNNAAVVLSATISKNKVQSSTVGAPIIKEGFYAILVQGTMSSGSNAVKVDAFEAGLQYYKVTQDFQATNPAAPSVEPTADPTAAPGMPLPDPVSISVGDVDMQITKYDTPVYIVNTSAQLKDTEGNLFEVIKPAITTDASNWNAKFVWNSNEGIPTLYINGLIIDDYNEEKSLWRANPNNPTTMLTNTAISIPNGRYTRVVITGADSQFKVRNGIKFESKLRLESEGDAKLDIWGHITGIYGTTGMPLVLNANLDVWLNSYADGSKSHMILTENADITINGGTIKLDTATERSAAIIARNGGNIIINGGNITARGTQDTAFQNGTIQSQNGTITVNDGTLNLTARSAVCMYAKLGIEINGGILNLSSPSYGITAGTSSAVATIEINGGTTTIIGKNASNSKVCAIIPGEGMYAYAGAGPRSAELYNSNDLKQMKKQMEKPWLLFTDDESKKIDTDQTLPEEDDDILESTGATTESTAPTTGGSTVDPTATQATIPEGTTPDDKLPEDGENDEDYGDYFDITPNLCITSGISDEIPEALIELGIDSADMIRDILVEMVWAVDDYADYFAFFDIKLMYHNGEDWVEAGEEHYPEEGYITAMLPYPEGTDIDTPFTAVHMFTSDAFGMTPGDVELLMPVNTEDGILVELVGLSPVALAWEGLAENEDNFKTGDTGIGVYVTLMVVAVLGMTGTVMLDNKKKRKA